VTGRGGRPRKDLPQGSDRFAALADPTRRRLLERLAEGDRTVGELVAGSGVSQAAVSQHLKVLREAGLVTSVREGRSQRYSLEPAGFAPLRDWLDELDRFWRARLQSLRDYLDSGP
jgi:DNA-binding transcriptional ArsR family regulator